MDELQDALPISPENLCIGTICVIEGRQIHRVIIFDISMVHFAQKNNINCILSCARILQRFSFDNTSIRVSVIMKVFWRANYKVY